MINGSRETSRTRACWCFLAESVVDILESDNILALFIYFVLRMSVKNVQEEQNVEIFHCQKCIKIALKLNDYSEEISCD